MKVLKFGGSSIADPGKISAVIDLVKPRLEQGEKLCLVFSAFGGVTDKLIEAGATAASGNEAYKAVYLELEKRHIQTVKDLLPPRVQSMPLTNVKLLLNDLADVLHGIYLLQELSPKILDFVSSFGERLSTYIISEVMRAQGIQAAYTDARELIRTDDHFGSARVDFPKTNENIATLFDNNSTLQLITGFIASDEKGQTTTLGRSGSDYTAAIVGGAIGAEEIEIWTDVDGMMTADPRKVPEAFPVESMSYQEAIEMSHFGARVIYPATMQPAMARNIPIRIKNTFNPSFGGTLISGKVQGKQPMIKGISSINQVSLLSLQGSGMMGMVGTSMRLFAALARKGVNVILISQASSEYSICIAVDPRFTDTARRELESEFRYEMSLGQIEAIQVMANLSIVALVGENMKHSPGVAGRMFRALGRNGINVFAISQGSSELNISAVVSQRDEAKALNALHEAFFLSDRKTIPVFLVGTGLVGSTLLSIIRKNKERIGTQQSIAIRLSGLANSRHMLIEEQGIDPQAWEERLAAGDPADIGRFVERIEELNLPNSIFVDCTASNEVVTFYQRVLDRSISVVTPNKRANSGSLDEYRELRRASSRFGVKYLYETNVGAGLPVINTLNDLLNSGDQVLKIEAVLSGTISYIFNTFAAGMRFSQVVRDARVKGLTEPDPREDLNGMDVARKILILAREVGEDLELKDVEVENLVPENCREAASVDAFFSELEKSDGYFLQKAERATKEGKRLRYIATLEGGRASVRLRAVGSDHPFYDLSGSDNIISYTTSRYRERPLVIKGPGAGAEVTAAGVFADILRIANYSLE
ncbi:MAG: bifunctional aspartate kinase/homoserine dehydrogenase I [Solitalea sp.]